jgi:long-chain fatty acid transport protein
MKRLLGPGLRTSAILAICVSLNVGILCRSTFANGIEVDALEATSGGRGGTNIAQSDNGAVLLSNPAAILNVDGDGLVEFGADGLLTDLHYSNPRNDDVAAHTRPMALPMFSVIEKLPDDNWAVGLGVFAPAGFAAGWDLNNNVEGNQSYKSFGSLIKVLPAVSYRVADGLTIGGTFGLAASYVSLDTPFNIQTGPFAGVPVHMKLIGDGYAPTWSLGMQYQLSPVTTFGLAYISEDRFDLDGHVHADVYGLGPNPIPTEFNSRLHINWPQSVGAGFKHMLTPNQRVSADVIWYDWKNAFQDAGLTLTDSTNPLFTHVLGPSFHDSIPLNWMDSFSVKVGYEWFYSPHNVFRAGYIYNQPQSPSDTLTPLIPAILEHTFTIGHGTTWGGWRFDIAYQYAFGTERHEDTSALAGGDFSNSTFSSQAHWLMLSATYQW